MQMQLAFRGEVKNLSRWAAELGTSPGRLKLRMARIGKDAALGDYLPRSDTADGFVDAFTPYVRDRRCQRMVRHFPDGLTLTQVAELMGGICRERVRQIEAVALAKIRCAKRLEHLLGVGPAEQLLIELRGKGLRQYRRAIASALGGL